MGSRTRNRVMKREARILRVLATLSVGKEILCESASLGRGFRSAP